jgi:hypothetical protein
VERRQKVVELQRGNDKGLGNVRRYTWKSKLPYRLNFDMKTTRVEPFTVPEGDASGELAGKGIGHLSTEGSDTIARNDWQVDTTQAWMKLMAPVARPFFAWNHDVIMRWGAQGLAKRLGVKVVEQKTHRAAPPLLDAAVRVQQTGGD